MEGGHDRSKLGLRDERTSLHRKKQSVHDLLEETFKVYSEEIKGRGWRFCHKHDKNVFIFEQQGIDLVKRQIFKAFSA